MNRVLPIDRPDMEKAGKPEVLWFGPEGASCFGMLHKPDAASKRGVIFCNALGFEGSLAHRSYRHMADDLVAAGSWVLRFDYEGEGDSDGGSWEPDRVAAWIADIDAAVAVLRARGVTHIQLVGFRIGAAFACRYATSHPGIAGVVLWTPCARGSEYVRELRALSRFSAMARPPQRVPADWVPKDSMEIVGFELSGSTLRDLAEIDLCEAPTPCVPPAMLIIDRDDAPAQDKLVAKFRDAGSCVEHEHMAGYEDFVSDSELNSVLPTETIDRIVGWLGARARTVEALDALPDDSRNDAGALVESATLTVSDPTTGRPDAPGALFGCVTEQATWINGRFFAIVSAPAETAPHRRAAIVLCNAGSVNRVGPGRLYVTLARYWAGLGFTVVRVDLGGVGDSLDVDPLTENQPHAPERAEEITEICTWLRQWTGFDHIAAYGLCSGAVNAFHAVTQGLDVDHVMLVNPGMFYLGPRGQSFSTPANALHSAHLMTRGFFDRKRWKAALRDHETLRRDLRRVRDLFGKRAVAGYRVLVSVALRNAARRVGLPVNAASPLPRDLNEIVERGVKVHIVFSTGESTASHLRTLGGQEYARLLDGDDFTIVNIEGGDHIFSPPGARQALIEKTTAYLESVYPA